MSYTKTKLSIRDKEILQEIYEELEDIHIRTTYQYDNRKNNTKGHSTRTGTINQKNARQTSFGKIYYQGIYKSSASTLRYPHILKFFKKFIKSHCPTFKFKSVYVNKNTICNKHLDSGNTGESLLVGFGKYTGGKTILYINNKPTKFHIKTTSLIFNGSEIEHKSEKFKGTRYSLVFFK
jgi:hypothetical protein